MSMRRTVLKHLKTAFTPLTARNDSRQTPPVIVDDVLIEILCFCDILTVISISQACKRFHTLAFFHQVWLALLASLHARNFIDLLPGQRLQDLSTKALIDLAKCTVQGPRSWSEPNTSGICVARSISLNPDLRPLPLSHNFQVKLLPGGRFVLFTNRGHLRCWSVHEDKLVWAYQCDWKGSMACVDQVSAEVVDGGRVAVIAVGVSSPIMPFLNGKSVDVVHLDLWQGSSHSVVCHDLPGLVETEIPFSTQICSDFALARLGSPYDNKIHLLKLSTKSCRTFTMEPHYYQVELIPGYMILVESNVNASNSFRIWNTDMLMGLPGDQDHAIKLDVVPPLLSQGVPFNWSPGSAMCLSAHASPVQEGLYTIWVTVVLGGVIVIHRYRLSAVDPRRLSFQRASSKPLVLWENYFREDMRISYAGHINAVSRSRHNRQILPLAKWISGTPSKKIPSNKWRKKDLKFAPRAVTLPQHYLDGPVQLSAYSGVSTVCKDQRIVIDYYD